MKNEDKAKVANPMKPPFWKEVVITVAAVYPLILGFDWVLRHVLPVEKMAFELLLFINVVIVVVLMVYPVMPFVIKITSPWLFKSSRKSRS